MKIFLLSSFWRPITGGMSSYVAAIRDRLRTYGNDVSIVALEGEPEKGVFVFTGSKPRVVTGLVRTLTRERPDVAHVQGHWLLLLCALLVKMRYPSMRLVFTFHTLLPL